MSIKELKHHAEWTVAYQTNIKILKDTTMITIVGKLGEEDYKSYDISIGDIPKFQIGTKYRHGGVDKSFLKSLIKGSIEFEKINTEFNHVKLIPFSEIPKDKARAKEIAEKRNIEAGSHPMYLCIEDFKCSSHPGIKKVYIPCYTVLSSLWHGSDSFRQALFSGNDPEKNMFNRDKSGAPVGGVCSVYLNKHMRDQDKNIIAEIAHNKYTYDRARNIHIDSIRLASGEGRNLGVIAYPPFESYEYMTTTGKLIGDSYWVFNVIEARPGRKTLDRVNFSRPGDYDRSNPYSKEKAKKKQIPTKPAPKENKEEKPQQHSIVDTPGYDLRPKENMDILEPNVYRNDIDFIKDTENLNHKKEGVKKVDIKEENTNETTSSKSQDNSGSSQKINNIPLGDGIIGISNLFKALSKFSDIKSLRTFDLPFIEVEEVKGLYYFPCQERPWMKVSYFDSSIEKKLSRDSILSFFEFIYEGKTIYMIDFERHKSNPSPNPLIFSKKLGDQFSSEEVKDVLDVLTENKARREWAKKHPDYKASRTSRFNQGNGKRKDSLELIPIIEKALKNHIL